MTGNNYILSIETSQKILSISLFESTNLLAEFNCYMANSHDRLLAVYVQRLISDHLKSDYSKIKYIALSAGPGSYTGLRIGAAFTKGICYGADIKLIAVPTLSAIANEARNLKPANLNPIIAVLPSHKELYYYQKFDSHAEPTSEILFDSLENIISEVSANYMMCGISLEQNSNEFVEVHPNSVIVANYAMKMSEQKNFTDIDTFEPIYVSDFVPKTSTKKLNI